MSSPAAFEFEPLTPDEAAIAASKVEPGVRIALAAEVLEQAHAEAAGIREMARQEGYEAGYMQGMVAAGERLDPIVAALGEAHAALGEERLRSADVVERAAVELALALAEKTLGAALEARPEHVVDVVRGGLRRLIERDRVLVLVHPEDLDLVRDATSALRLELGGIGELDVQAERRVARGGAIVRTATAEVDGRLQTQLDRARETLLAALTPSETPA